MQMHQKGGFHRIVNPVTTRQIQIKSTGVLYLL